MAGRTWAPEVDSRAYDAMVEIAQRVQVVAGVVALAALWLVGGVPARDKLIVTALLFGVYLPWTILTPKMARSAPRVVNLAVDLAAMASFPLLIPETRVAVMVAYVLMVGFHAYASGRNVALLVVAGVLSVTALAEGLAPAADRLDAFTLVMYATVLVTFTYMLDALAGERRDLVRHLSRLTDALSAVTHEPDVERTLSSVAHAARDAVDAGFVVVLLLRDGRIDVGFQVSTRESVIDLANDDPRIHEVLDAIAADPASTPSGRAILERTAVAVSDVATDSRFRSFSEISQALDVRSVVSVPLVLGESCLGALVAYWPDPNAFVPDDVTLLAAYARQATFAVTRALAYDSEREAAARLADADRMKSEFVARVSHELRTPLTAINGFISTVLLHWDVLDDNAKRELLTRAGRNTGDLRRLVEQVLAFARTGDAAATIHARPLALAAEIDNLVAHLMPVLGDHAVDLDVHPAIVVLADREALHHVLTNLLANAAKFSPGGSPIRVSARNDGEWVEIGVRDEGPGIAPDEQERIFERFYRSSSVSAKGTGIGLSIVSSLVEQLGGKVWVESTPDEGATFTFTLPRAELAPKAAEQPAAGVEELVS